MSSYYEDKLSTLQRLFGRPVELGPDHIQVAQQRYEIEDDVILLIPRAPRAAGPAERVRASFGDEWTQYLRVLPEHRKEFEAYFDLVDPKDLERSLVCDLGCGMGRWSYFLKDHCAGLVLVDFSEAIFAARKNLSDAPHALFFMGDLTQLPFADDFSDFLLCLGVLHHLPSPCLDAVRGLRRASPRLLIYLYYALDNRPAYFRWILAVVTALRRMLSHVRSPSFRRIFSFLAARLVYGPLVLAGRLLRPIGLHRLVPLFEYYQGLSSARIEQDVYDRFFTPIEQRVSRAEILTLRDTFGDVRVSDGLPYWHFLCSR